MTPVDVSALGRATWTYSVEVEGQLAFKCAHAPILDMNSGHSEKGREFCIRTETCLIDRDCSILMVASPPPPERLTSGQKQPGSPGR